MATNLDSRDFQRMQAMGMAAIPVERGLIVLEQLLSQSATQVGVMPINWSQLNATSALTSQFFANFTQEVSQSVEQKAELRAQLVASDESDRQNLLINYLQEQVGKILGFKDSQLPSLEQNFFEMGIDSLMVVELRNKIQTDLKLDIAIATLMEGATIVSLSTKLNHQLAPINVTQTVEPETNQQLQPANVKNSDWIEIEI
jgi:acyl carrier protein